MRVFIDVTAAAKARKTGIGHYVARLVEAMLAEDPALRLTQGVRLGLDRRPAHAPHRNGSSHDRVRTRWFWTRWPGLAAAGADLVHGPDARLVGGRPPQVVTFHDVFNLKEHAWASPSFRERKAERYAEAASRAARVLCVSEATAREVETRLHVPRARIVVTPLGVEAGFSPWTPARCAPVLARLGVRPPYVLFVGLAQPRKNLESIAAVFGRLAARRPDLTLVLAGEDGYPSGRLAQILNATGASDRVRLTGYVPHEDLPALYGAAACLLFPSLDEGFGLPVLEAMACGCPVVTSNAGALPEVVGGGGCTAAPDAVEELEGWVERLLEDADLRRSEIERGVLHARAFTWARTARATLAAYGAALGIGPGDRARHKVTA